LILFDMNVVNSVSSSHLAVSLLSFNNTSLLSQEVLTTTNMYWLFVIDNIQSQKERNKEKINK